MGQAATTRDTSLWEAGNLFINAGYELFGNHADYATALATATPAQRDYFFIVSNGLGDMREGFKESLEMMVKLTLVSIEEVRAAGRVGRRAGWAHSRQDAVCLQTACGPCRKHCTSNRHRAIIFLAAHSACRNQPSRPH